MIKLELVGVPLVFGFADASRIPNAESDHVRIYTMMADWVFDKNTGEFIKIRHASPDAVNYYIKLAKGM